MMFSFMQVQILAGAAAFSNETMMKLKKFP